MSYPNSNKRPPRSINFTNDPEPAPKRPEARGLRDEDWDDDEFTTPPSRRPAPQFDEPERPVYDDRSYADSRRDAHYSYRDQNDVYSGYNSTMNDQQTPRNQGYNSQSAYPDNAVGNGGGSLPPRYERDPYDGEEPPRPRSFVKRHPIIFNALLICITAVAIGWLLMLFLDVWTFHGQERVVPDVKNMQLYEAYNNVDHADLNPVLSDSIYDSTLKPGTVVDQIPIAGSRIKKNGTVYLTIVAFTPKMITVPDFYNVSARQERSLFEALGITKIREDSVLSEYEGLVLGARFNGVSLRPGARIPVTSVVTLEVGTGLDRFDENGAPIDSVAIENAVQEIEHLDID